MYRLNLYSNYKFQLNPEKKTLDFRNNCLSIDIIENDMKNMSISINGKSRKLLQPFVLDCTVSKDRLFLRDTTGYDFAFVPDTVKNILEDHIKDVFFRKLVRKKKVSTESILEAVRIFFQSDGVLIPSWYVNTSVFTGPLRMLGYNDLAGLFFHNDYELVQISISRSALKKSIWKYRLLNTMRNNYKKDSVKVVIPEKFVYNLKDCKIDKRFDTTLLQSIFSVIRSQKF